MQSKSKTKIFLTNRIRDKDKLFKDFCYSLTNLFDWKRSKVEIANLLRFLGLAAMPILYKHLLLNQSNPFWIQPETRHVLVKFNPVSLNVLIILEFMC